MVMWFMVCVSVSAVLRFGRLCWIADMVLLEEKDVWSSKCVDFLSPRKTASLGVYGSDFGLVS